ncbi:MAG: cytochrome c oxidase subunit II [Dehalococcoidia bacterium]
MATRAQRITPRTKVILATAAAPAACALLSACGSISSLDTVTDRGRHMTGLYLVTLGVGAVVLLLVTTVLVLALVRYRASAGGSASEVAENVRLEIAWTGATVLVLGAVFALSVGAMRAAAGDPPGEPAPMRIEVVGHQWWWEYRYEGDAPFVAANELHVPIGVPIDLVITSNDVVHSFWVPALGGKADAVPGRTQTLRVQASSAGHFEGTCAEFCGLQHAWMRILVVAESAEDFARWADGQRAPASSPAAGAAAAGAQVFESQTCANCHAIGGSGAAGNVGPDLTHFASRETLGAGVAPNDAKHLGDWIRDPDGLKPGVLMPSFPRLTDQQISDLVAYLQGLK